MVAEKIYFVVFFHQNMKPLYNLILGELKSSSKMLKALIIIFFRFKKILLVNSLKFLIFVTK